MITDTETKQVDSNIVEKLFSIGAHYAFSKARRHPSSKPFIFGTKNTVEIFDLEKTIEELEVAKSYAEELGKAGKNILFVGGKNEAHDAIKEAGQKLEMPYVAGRWIGGSLTNFPQIKKRILKLQKLTDEREKGELSKYTKKERLMIDREITSLEDSFLGLIAMKNIPDAMFVVDLGREHSAVKEATDLGLKVISLSNSDCNLDLVDYAIPANDSNKNSIEYFVGQIVEAYEKGKKSAPAPVATDATKK